MCGRIATESDITEILERFNAQLHTPFFDWDSFHDKDDIKPGREIPTIGKTMTGSNVHRFQALLWGWKYDRKTKDKAGKPKIVKTTVINSNTATILKNYGNPWFKYLKGVDANRVIIPANAFFEWPTIDGQKVRHRIEVKGQDLFGIAGYEVMWQRPDQMWEPTVVLITRDAPEGFKPTHDAEPVILRPEDEKSWLNPSIQGADYLKSIFDKPNLEYVITSIG